MRIISIMFVNNCEVFMPRVLDHLAEQGVGAYVIDHGSTDRTAEIVAAHHNVVGWESMQNTGVYDLAEMLRRVETLTFELEADWFIRQDADELREAPLPYGTLAEAIEQLDGEGYNAIDFEEFTFLPTSQEDDFNHPGWDREMRYYLLHAAPGQAHIKAWRKQPAPVDLVSSGGHRVAFPKRRVAPAKFVLRHYIMLSYAQGLAKYGSRRFAMKNAERGWHRGRAVFQPDDLQLPTPEMMCEYRFDRQWDRSRPYASLPIFPDADRRYDEWRAAKLRRQSRVRWVVPKAARRRLSQMPVIWRLMQ